MADKFQIVIKKGPTPGQVIDLKEDIVTLGREPGNVLTINDKGLSRVHARLVKTDAGYTLEDMDSKNGTFVNGAVLVAPRPLQSGDQITIGENVILEFHKASSFLGGIFGSGSGKSEETVMMPSRAVLQEELRHNA